MAGVVANGRYLSGVLAGSDSPPSVERNRKYRKIDPSYYSQDVGCGGLCVKALECPYEACSLDSQRTAGLIANYRRQRREEQKA